VETLANISKVLGGKKCLGRAVTTPTDFDEIIREGIPFECASHAQTALSLNDSLLASVLSLSRRSLVRLRKANKRLSLTASDRLFRVVRLFAFAAEVLEGSDQAKKWLISPQVGLGGRVPLEFLETEVGTREVEALLGRIEYGVLA
jgi:putative toxin-antitoxin system antitoxin component (TIGR02293 family)